MEDLWELEFGFYPK